MSFRKKSYTQKPQIIFPEPESDNEISNIAKRIRPLGYIEELELAPLEEDNLEFMKKGGRKKVISANAAKAIRKTISASSRIKNQNKQGNINIKINIGKEREALDEERIVQERLERAVRSEKSKSRTRPTQKSIPKKDMNEPLKPSSFVKLLSRTDTEPLNKIYSGNAFRVSSTTPFFGGMTPRALQPSTYTIPTTIQSGPILGTYQPVVQTTTPKETKEEKEDFDTKLKKSLLNEEFRKQLGLTPKDKNNTFNAFKSNFEKPQEKKDQNESDNIATDKGKPQVSANAAKAISANAAKAIVNEVFVGPPAPVIIEPIVGEPVAEPIALAALADIVEPVVSTKSYSSILSKTDFQNMYKKLLDEGKGNFKDSFSAFKNKNRDQQEEIINNFSSLLPEIYLKEKLISEAGEVKGQKYKIQNKMDEIYNKWLELSPQVQARQEFEEDQGDEKDEISANAAKAISANAAKAIELAPLEEPRQVFKKNTYFDEEEF